MPDSTLTTRAFHFPKPANGQLAALGWERFIEAAGRSDLETLAQAAYHHTESRRIFESLFGNSPYLTQSCLHEPAFALRLLEEDPESLFAEMMRSLDRLRGDPPPFAELAKALRVAKRRGALLIALADIGGLWPLTKITAALSDLAEKTLTCAAARVLLDAADRNAFKLADRKNPETGSGLVVIGMGKLGARELNYSSDIDLIVLYDSDRITTDAPENLQTHFVRLTRNLVKLMDERTADGYVFRTDLRLRPDPGSTPIALSVLAAETYYETIGQNWERAAMIKARPVCGDLEAGAQFLQNLKPFIWRKNLDFAAIHDIHTIKRQINAQRGGEAITAEGHNVKLGRGGIREIEFFVQTQQLIWGGRHPHLRERETAPMLHAFAAFDRISKEAAEEMSESYAFLRTVEHRLQMIEDQQTHQLPKDQEAMDRLAVFLGYSGRDLFVEELIGHLNRVERHYGELFQDRREKDRGQDGQGKSIFTGADDDPETLITLKKMGYDNPEAVSAIIRAWHHGRYACTRSVRARELLTQVIPALLSAVSKTPDPSHTFFRLDRFLSHLPTGVQLFSMFQANPKLLDLLAEILGGAPRLADHLARRPAVLDSVLDPDYMGAPPDAKELARELTGLFSSSRYFEETLDVARRWANDRRLQIGIQMLRGLISAKDAAKALTALAETALSCLMPVVHESFAQSHGVLSEADMMVLGMGKMGGREMTPTSDLDLIFVYRATDPEAPSSGPRALLPSQYFARLSQRLINAISAPTAEGTMFEVDMRLRPSGNAGPIASSLRSFVDYQRDRAWTWEYMALTRARPVCGPQSLIDQVEAIIFETLTREFDAPSLLRDVAHMRERIQLEKGSDSPWEIKTFRGGLVDVEFIAQYLQLRHAHTNPDILDQNTLSALEKLHRAGLLSDRAADDLMEAADLWQSLQAIQRLSVEGPFDLKKGLGRSLEKTLAEACGVADFADLEDKIRALAGRAYAHYNEIIDGPASELPPTDETAS